MNLSFDLFVWLLSDLFYFSCQDASITGSKNAIIGSNSSNKDKLALYQIQSGEPNYKNHKILFNIPLGVTCTKILRSTSK